MLKSYFSYLKNIIVMVTTGNIFLVVSLWCSHICKEKTLKERRRALFFCLDVPTYSSTSSDVRTRRWHDPPSLFFRFTYTYVKAEMRLHGSFSFSCDILEKRRRNRRSRPPSASIFYVEFSPYSQIRKQRQACCPIS